MSFCFGCADSQFYVQPFCNSKDNGSRPLGLVRHDLLHRMDRRSAPCDVAASGTPLPEAIRTLGLKNVGSIPKALTRVLKLRTAGPDPKERRRGLTFPLHWSEFSPKIPQNAAREPQLKQKNVHPPLPPQGSPCTPTDPPVSA